MLTAALKNAKTEAMKNPRLVLPQLFKPKGITSTHPFVHQLLMPLHLNSRRTADCALTVQLRPDPDVEGGWMYISATVLPLAWAYQNARIINSVESPWLQRIIEDQRAQIDDLSAQLAAATGSSAVV